ncbi:MAG: hypothetical protein Q8R30_00900 [bacterium]|nr:hypothetical protein [bacterium]MDZ4286101.1 hypothetical protein [Candidatus Sungbacteria bacterium]
MKYIYITAFTILGILLQFLLHAGIEIWYVGLLLNDFATYGLGFTWEQWEMIHAVLAIIFLFGGALFGYLQGQYWWKRIYERR